MRFLFKAGTILSLLLLIGLLAIIPLQAQTATNSSSATWVAVFYASTTPGSGNSATATFTGLSQNWASSPTDASGNALANIPADGWSARFNTTVTLTTGFWEFTAVADDGVRVLVNGNPVIDALSATGSNSHSAVTNLSNGTYNILVEFVDISGAATIQVNWFPSTGESTTGTATVAPAAIANVVTVKGLSVRTGPFLGASRIAVARPNTDYPVLARNTQEGLFTWYKIQFDTDTIGWVSGRYLSFPVGDPDLIDLQNSTIFDEVEDPPGFVKGITRSVMNFRVHPSPRVARIAAVPQLFWGAEVEILARTVQGGRDHWYQVRYTPEGSDTSYVGWIIHRDDPDWLWVVTAPGSDPIQTVPIR